jgi:hypothetical protein
MTKWPPIISKAFPALTQVMLKLSITILFTAPFALSPPRLIRLLTALAVQSAYNIDILLSITRRLPFLLHILRPILGVTVRFLAR